jgi:hypothetical protein
LFGKGKRREGREGVQSKIQGSRRGERAVDFCALLVTEERKKKFLVVEKKEKGKKKSK